jgi:hypothetical protein
MALFLNATHLRSECSHKIADSYFLFDNSTTRQLDNSTARQLDSSTTRQLDNSTARKYRKRSRVGIKKIDDSLSLSLQLRPVPRSCPILPKVVNSECDHSCVISSILSGNCSCKIQTLSQVHSYLLVAVTWVVQCSARQCKTAIVNPALTR